MSKAANTGNGFPSGMKNRIINGGMDIAQRATSFANANGYTLDRFYAANATDGQFTVTQNSDVPSNNEFNKSLRLTVTAAETSLGAAQRAVIYQGLEGYNVRDFVGRTFTLSFYVRSTKTGIHCLSFRNGVANRSYIVEYTINASNTWEYKTVTIVGGLSLSDNADWTSAACLSVNWCLCSGTDTIGTAGSWLNGNFIATSNQVNCLDNAVLPNIFAITGVQLELGPVATPFEHRLYSAELALCQRYFYSIKSTTNTLIGIGGCTSSTNAYAVVFFPVTMRVAPNSIASSTSLTSIYVSGIGASFATAVALSVPSPSGTNLVITGTAMSQGIAVIHWNAAGQINFDGAEL